ncbi:MAG: rRNA maturation RNase YbeY [Candidatus Dormibacteraeota bacterium]|uniref:Endoribonuclease YbeY n=1 Tax=Candidatus Aeolococcus gillhamiae TaxID=3127015 RepID=A0A934N9L4_9BACT|nr:rRNA maturation RNase YbeY [Candidatus Dormibacteraeota bacterium]
MTIGRADSVTLAAQREAIRCARLGPLLRRCGDALRVGSRANLAVRLTDDTELTELSARFLGVAAPTDVLAFPSDERDRVGDIAISVERALAQGNGDGPAELRLLVVHGLLHCLGHDHAGAAEAAAMTAATRRLLPHQTVAALVPANG